MAGLRAQAKQFIASRPSLHPLIKVVKKTRALRRQVDPSGCYYNIENPKKQISDDSKVVIDGWVVPRKKAPFVKLRVKNGNTYTDVPSGFRRADVAKSFPELDAGQAINSGFSLELEFEDGLLELEVDIGKGFHKIYSTNLRYSPETLPETLFNPNLSQLWPEHVNMLDNKSKYFYEKQLAKNFERKNDDPRLLALYLPQFHPIPENDANWGKNFTEWTNVTQGAPRFVGHLQPILPQDLGYYDLRVEENIKAQIDLAKHHGIYGFCMYYYWFSGKKVMDRPLNTFLEHKEWDFNFAICWANENWTKRWDGRDSDVIIAQEYLPEDPLNFIKDVEHILLDSRYITEDGKPLLMVYRPTDLDDPARYAKTWRDYFREKHGKELHLVSVISFDDKDPRTYGFDAAMDFAPQGTFFKNEYFESGIYPLMNVQDKLLDVNFEGDVADFRTIVLNRKLYDAFDFPTYKCVMPSWDNDARKKGRGFVFQNSSPDLYAQSLDYTLTRETEQTKSPLVFINAWNEWAEGAMIEPSLHYGHAVLNRTSEVLAKHSGRSDAWPLYGIQRPGDVETAVVLHLFYPELWELFKARSAVLKSVPHSLFVTLTKKDQEFAATIKKFDPDVQIFIVPNRGRDVLPFVHIARRLQAAGYKYVLKMHGKQSKHRSDGGDWLDDLVTKLLPDVEGVNGYLRLLQNGASMVGPEGHFVSFKKYMGGSGQHVETLLSKTHDVQTARQVMSKADQYGFFAGTMFWASLETLRPLLDLYLMPEDFESEHGQIDGTMAHAVERVLGLLAVLQGEAYLSNGKTASAEEIITGYKYAP